jgi:hypothetical protein
MRLASYITAMCLAAGSASAAPLNCPGNSCNVPGHNAPVIGTSPHDNGPAPIEEPTTSVIGIQINAAPVRTIVRNVRVRSRTGISGVTISATAVGNYSAVTVTRGQ